MDTHAQKISHLKALFYLACADKELTRVEATYIIKVAERLGVPLSELENFDGKEPDLELPNREYKLFSIFHRLAIIIMVDQEINETERRYCFDLGIKMGLHPNAVGEIIDYVVKKGGGLNATPADIIGIFRKYMN